MNKRVLYILLAACMLFSLLGCQTVDRGDRIESGNKETGDKNPSEDQLRDDTTDPQAPSVDVTESAVGSQDLDDPVENEDPSAGNDPSSPGQNDPQPPESGNEDPSENEPPKNDPDEDDPPENNPGENDPTPPEVGGAEEPLTDYERYNNMSGEEQKAFIDSFESIEAFFEWYNAAKEEYEALHPDIEVGGDGNVDLGGNG